MLLSFLVSGCPGNRNAYVLLSQWLSWQQKCLYPIKSVVVMATEMHPIKSVVVLATEMHPMKSELYMFM